MNDPILQNAYIDLSTMLRAIGAAYGVCGAQNVMESIEKNAPSVKDLGERQLRMAGNLVILAAYIRERTLPPPEVVEFMAQWVYS